jgi:hypothetical protein
MAKIVISFDDQQIQQIEQIIMDQDEPGALRCIVSLRKMIKRGQIGCAPLEFKAKESVDHVIGKTKKHL